RWSLRTLRIRRWGDVGVVDVRTSLSKETHALGEERTADRGDERREARRVAGRPGGGSLEAGNQGAGRQPGQRENCEERDHRTQGECPSLPKAEDRQKRGGEKRSKGEYVAVSEIDELDDPVDHRVAERDQRVDAAVGDREREDLDEEGAAL